MARAQPGIWVRRLMAMAGIILCPVVVAANPPPADKTGDQTDLVLPTILFHGDAAADDLFDALHASPLLAHLSKEAPGSPIHLRIFHSVHPAHVDAKNFFSGLLSITTLGLSPVVMSGEHTMHYEIYVNGQRVSRHEYSANLSRKQYLNSKTADATHGLGTDGQVWAKSTVDLFLKDLAHDGAVRALDEEYRLYFGNAAPATPSATAQH